MNALSISSTTKSFIAAGTVGALSAYALGPANVWSISRLAIGALNGSLAYSTHLAYRKFTNMSLPLSVGVNLANVAASTAFIFKVWPGSAFYTGAAIIAVTLVYGIQSDIARQIGYEQRSRAAINSTNWANYGSLR